MGYADRDYYREDRPRGEASPSAPARIAPLLVCASVAALAADRLADRQGWLFQEWALKFRVEGLADGWHRWLTHPLAPPDLPEFAVAAVMAWIGGRALERRCGPLRTALVALAGAAAGALAYGVLRAGGSPAEPLAGLLPVAFAWCFHAARRIPRAEVGVFLPLRLPVPIRFFAWVAGGLAVMSLVSRNHALTAAAALAAAVAGAVFPVAAPVPVPARRRRTRRAAAAERKAAGRQARPDADAELDAELDRLLAKISAEGMASLTPTERRTLEQASRVKREALGR